MRLHRRFDKADIDAQAKRRARKRKQENCYKDTKEKHKRLVSKCVEVVQRIAPGVAKMHEATIEESVFSLTFLEGDITETPALLLRYKKGIDQIN